MKLDPSPKPVRIRLSVGNGKDVFFKKEDLLKNFDFNLLAPLFEDKSIERWLLQIGEKEISEQIAHCLGANPSNEFIIEKAYELVHILFDSIEAAEYHDKKTFLTFLLQLRASIEFKKTIQNVLDSFNDYCDFPFLDDLSKSAETPIKKMIDQTKERLQTNEKNKEGRNQKGEKIKEQIINDVKLIEVKCKTERESDVKITKVYIQENQLVKKDDRVMETISYAINAPCSGRIKQIFVKENEWVNIQSTLFTIIQD